MLARTYKIAASAIALSGVVGAIELHQPRATPVNNHYHENGWTPKPTTKPKPMIELFKRQEDDLEFCGYLTGDGYQPITCDAGETCMYNEGLSWFGCCTGTEITDCANVATACVRSSKYDECMSDTSCADDVLATSCTSGDYPYCALLYTTLSDSSFGHYICDSLSTSYEVVFTSSDIDESTFTLSTDFLSEDSTTSSRRTRTFDTSSITDDESITPMRTVTVTQSPSTESEEPSSTDASTTQAPGTSQGPAVASGSDTTTNAGAVVTAEAVAGVMGGAVGMLALLL